MGKAKTTKATSTETKQPPTVAKEERDILDLTKQIVDVRKDVQKEEGEIQDLRKDVTSVAGHQAGNNAKQTRANSHRASSSDSLSDLSKLGHHDHKGTGKGNG